MAPKKTATKTATSRQPTRNWDGESAETLAGFERAFKIAKKEMAKTPPDEPLIRALAVSLAAKSKLLYNGRKNKLGGLPLLKFSRRIAREYRQWHEEWEEEYHTPSIREISDNDESEDDQADDEEEEGSDQSDEELEQSSKEHLSPPIQALKDLGSSKESSLPPKKRKLTSALVSSSAKQRKFPRITPKRRTGNVVLEHRISSDDTSENDEPLPRTRGQNKLLHQVLKKSKPTGIKRLSTIRLEQIQPEARTPPRSTGVKKRKLGPKSKTGRLDSPATPLTSDKSSSPQSIPTGSRLVEDSSCETPELTIAITDQNTPSGSPAKCTK
jgi:hypothetical protein